MCRCLVYCLCLTFAACSSNDDIHESDRAAKSAIEGWGGKVRLDGDRVVGADLDGCEISDEDLAVLQSLEKLKYLWLSRTSITDDGLSHISSLVKLQRLELAETKISDSGLSHLSGLGSLEWLDLIQSQVTDNGLKTLSRLPNLRLLKLRQTKVSAAGMKAFRRSRPRCDSSEIVSPGVCAADEETNIARVVNADRLTRRVRFLFCRFSCIDFLLRT